MLSRSRRILISILFGMIVTGALDPRATISIPARARPDRKVAGYPRFLAQVAARTATGDAVAIAAPMRSWAGGYAYAYYRASYFLAGRRVVPLIGVDDSLHMERLRDAEYLAMWAVGPPGGPYEAVWSGHGGTLYRRVR